MVKNIFKDAKKTLDEMRQKEKLRLRAWDESRVEYIKRYRRNVREAYLNSEVPERICPLCKELRLKSRQWVVLKPRLTVRLKGTKLEGLKVVCRGCWKRYIGVKGQ